MEGGDRTGGALRSAALACRTDSFRSEIAILVCSAEPWTWAVVRGPAPLSNQIVAPLEILISLIFSPFNPIRAGTVEVGTLNVSLDILELGSLKRLYFEKHARRKRSKHSQFPPGIIKYLKLWYSCLEQNVQIF